MNFLARTSGIALLAGLAACTAASGDTSVAQGNEIQGGNTDSATIHNYAVGIANKLGAVCSGTLIAPNLVLTARHCVVAPGGNDVVTCADSFGDNTAPSNLFVTTDPVLSGKANLYPVAEITTPTDASFCGNDIALIRLAKNIPAAEAEPATPVVQFAISDATRLTGQVAALGYGITAPNADDPGTRHVRQDIDIICVPGDTTYDCTKTIYASMMDNDREFITAGYVCSGDSGGGAFDQGSFNKGGAPYVLGALSRGPSNDTECLAAVYSRTDAHADLIISTAKNAAQLGGYEPAGWVTGAPVATLAAEGTTCSGEICTSTDATDPSSDTTAIKKTSGCSAAPGSSSSATFGMMVVAAAIAAMRRRRSA